MSKYRLVKEEKQNGDTFYYTEWLDKERWRYFGGGSYSLDKAFEFFNDLDPHQVEITIIGEKEV